MYANRLITFFVICVFLASPVLVNWWAKDQDIWFQPFVVWLAFIATSFWMMRSSDLNE